MKRFLNAHVHFFRGHKPAASLVAECRHQLDANECQLLDACTCNSQQILVKRGVFDCFTGGKDSAKYEGMSKERKIIVKEAERLSSEANGKLIWPARNEPERIANLLILDTKFTAELNALGNPPMPKMWQDIGTSYDLRIEIRKVLKDGGHVKTARTIEPSIIDRRRLEMFWYERARASAYNGPGKNVFAPQEIKVQRTGSTGELVGHIVKINIARGGILSTVSRT